MPANVTFDVNQGFEQIDSRLKDFYDKSGRSVEVAFEIGNLHPSKHLNYAEVEYHSGNVQNADSADFKLAPNEANDCSYYQTTQHTDALQKLLVFRTGTSTGSPGFTCAIGVFLNPSEPTFQWFTLFFDDKKEKINVAGLKQGDLGELLGTRPNDTWPKWGEVIPGWDAGEGGWVVSSTGDQITFADGYWGVTAQMESDGAKFVVRAFAFSGWASDAPHSANSSAAVPD